MQARRIFYSSPQLMTLRVQAIEFQKAIARMRVQSWRFAEFGKNSVIWPPLTVAAPDRVAIGDSVSIGRGAWLSINASAANREGKPMLVMGSGVNFGTGAFIVCAERVEIGPDVLAANNVFIADTYHQYRDPDRPVLGQGMVPPRPVRIEAGAFLGVNAVVLPGVTIGERAYVGAGAVVTHDVPPRSVVVGNPARVVRQWDDASHSWTRVPRTASDGKS